MKTQTKSFLYNLAYSLGISAEEMDLIIQQGQQALKMYGPMDHPRVEDIKKDIGKLLPDDHRPHSPALVKPISREEARDLLYTTLLNANLPQDQIESIIEMSAAMRVGDVPDSVNYIVISEIFDDMRSPAHAISELNELRGILGEQHVEMPAKEVIIAMGEDLANSFMDLPSEVKLRVAAQITHFRNEHGLTVAQKEDILIYLETYPDTLFKSYMLTCTRSFDLIMEGAKARAERY